MKKLSDSLAFPRRMFVYTGSEHRQINNAYN